MRSPSSRWTRRRRGLRLVGVVVATTLAASATSAAQPISPGFTDGRWEGRIAWDVFLNFTDAIGYAESSGLFTVEYRGGIPTGRFEYATSDAVGATPEARAELMIHSSGTMAQTVVGTPLLVPESLSVTGDVVVYGVDRFPVEFTMGAGELSSIVLDIVTAGCTVVTGSFATHSGEVGAAVAAAGGSLSVQEAWWSALRVGDSTIAPSEQGDTLDALLKDGVAIAAAIDDGTVDLDALHFLVYRAEQIAIAIRRNDPCNIANPGLYTTVVAGLMTKILTKMVAKSDLFDLAALRVAVIAAVESGALGASAGAADDQLAEDLGNVLRERFTAAAAGNNKDDLALIATIASIYGDQDLVDLAVGELKKS